MHVVPVDDSKNSRFRPLLSGFTALLLTFILFCCILCACNDESAPKKEPPVTKGIHKTQERGPIKVTVNADKDEINIAQRIHLEIDVQIQEDFEVKLPPIGEKLDQFGIVDYHTSSPELTGDNSKRIVRTYTLEPMLSGEYVIPSMKIEFRKRDEQKDQVHAIETDPITIKVVSLLPEDMSKMKLNDIHPPVKIPSRMNWAVLTIVGSLITLCAVLGVWFFYYKRKRHERETLLQIPAHELAYQALEDLVAQNLPESGAIKRFYQELSNILRKYIENRFGVRAPEQTTEEFLSGLQSNRTLLDKYKALLGEFLKHCDLVKFAELEPRTQDIQNTFDSCKMFIEETKTEVV